MDKESKSAKTLKWFFYFDVAGINSIFNQLVPNITKVSFSSGAKKTISLNANVGLPMVLQGFQPFNASGEFARDIEGGTVDEIEITVEDKIDFLLNHFEYSSEKTFDTWDSDLYLGTGNFRMTSFDAFCRHFNKLHDDGIVSWNDFEQFIKQISSDDNFYKIWHDVVQVMYPKREDIDKDNEMFYWFKLSDPDYLFEKIAVDLKYPMLITFSAKKTLFSTSKMYFTSLMRDSSTGALGYVTRKAGMYYMKPLALWHDIDYVNDDKFCFQINYQSAEKKMHGHMPF